MDVIELREVTNSSSKKDKKYDAGVYINNNVIANNNNEILKGDVSINHGPVSQEAPEIVYLEDGFSPGFSYGLAYLLAAISFMSAFEFPGLPQLPYPLMGNLLPSNCLNDVEEMVIVLLGMYSFHFLKRFFEVLFIHKYNNPISCIDAFGANIYYTAWSFWIGWSINFHHGYKASHPAIFYFGILIYIIGEVGNFLSHLSLRRQVNINSYVHPDNGHLIPKGIMFKYVSMPNYFFEMVSWLGFALSSFTLPSFLFFLISVIVMLFRGYKKHQNYIKEFNGKDGTPLYPSNRKAVIPYLL